MEFYSHPDKLLTEHLLEVKNKGIDLLPKEYKEVYSIIALTHDFGKYTSFFQDHLLRNVKSNNLSSHGFISALFGAYVAFNRLGEESYLPLISYNVILHHHGNLENIKNNLPREIKVLNDEDYGELLTKVKVAKEQIENLKRNKEAIYQDLTKLGLENHFSIFIENDSVIKETLVRLLGKSEINIRALSLADTSDFGILRLILDEPTKGYDILKQYDFTVGKTDVKAVEVPDKPGGLASVLKVLRDNFINIEYMYAFVERSGECAVMIFRFDETENAIEALRSNDITIVPADKLYNL
jgi:CRISPR-associated endonuclease Cas3-HD